MPLSLKKLSHRKAIAQGQKRVRRKRRCLRRTVDGTTDACADQSALSSATISSSTFLASPKIMVVRGCSKSGRSEERRVGKEYRERVVRLRENRKENIESLRDKNR